MSLADSQYIMARGWWSRNGNLALIQSRAPEVEGMDERLLSLVMLGVCPVHCRHAKFLTEERVILAMIPLRVTPSGTEGLDTVSYIGDTVFTNHSFSLQSRSRGWQPFEGSPDAPHRIITWLSKSGPCDVEGWTDFADVHAPWARPPPHLATPSAVCRYVERLLAWQKLLYSFLFREVGYRGIYFCTAELSLFLSRIMIRNRVE